MNRIFITLATIGNEDERYIAISNGKEAALYKRYFSIVYIRWSKVYTEYHIWTTLVNLAIVKNMNFKQ